MSILIKGINTSKDCWGCKFRRQENGYGDLCIITGAFIKDVFIKEKNCPLVEVPASHGRLIDADELWKRHHNQYRGLCLHFGTNYETVDYYWGRKERGMRYDFSKYICGVTGLTCCGCSLFCEHRKGREE